MIKKSVNTYVKHGIYQLINWIWKASVLNAVKRIVITRHTNNNSHKRHLFDKEMIEKLLCCFPNLKDVAVYDPFIDYIDFNDDICKIILQKCPKLDTFEINLELAPRSWFDDDAKYQEKQDQYLDSHCNLR